jgi:hypothetical protein
MYSIHITIPEALWRGITHEILLQIILPEINDIVDVKMYIITLEHKIYYY